MIRQCFFKKIFISVLTCALFILLVTSCNNESTGRTAGGDITLSYWVQNDTTFINAARRIAESYSEEHDNVTVVVETFRDFWTQVYTSLAADTCGDVVEMYGSTLRFAMNDVITPVPETVMTVDEIENTFFPASLSNRRYEGLYYGLPADVTIETPGLLVNVALLESQGFEVPVSWYENDGPASWDELIQLAHQLTIIEDGLMVQAGLGIVGGEEVSMLLSLIWQFGGDFSDSDSMKVNFDTPEAVKAAEFIMDLITEPNAVHSSLFRSRREGFMEGKIAMTLAAPWAALIIDREREDFEYVYFNLPSFVAGSQPYFLGEGGWGYMVPATTDNLIDSWDFVIYRLSDEYLLELMMITGNLPANMNLTESEYFTTGAVSDIFGKAIKMLPYGRDFGSFADPSILFWETAYNNLRAITTEHVPIQTGLTNMENEINEIIDMMNSGELFE